MHCLRAVFAAPLSSAAWCFDAAFSARGNPG